MKLFAAVTLVLAIGAVFSAPLTEEEEKRNILAGASGLLNTLGGLVGGSSGGASGIISGLTGLLGGSGGSGGAAGLLGGLSGLLGGGGATGGAAGSTGAAATGGAATTGTAAATGGAAAGTAGAAGAAGGLPIGAISGLTDGVLNLANSIISGGRNDPHAGTDSHHNAAEHGAQSAILKALQNESFGK